MGTAAVTPTYGLRGANTSSFVITATALDSTITNALLVANQPAGQLLTFLSTGFASAAAVDTAFRALGGYFQVRQTGGTASTSVFEIFWVAAGPSTVPALTVRGVGSTDYVLEITMGAVHSIAA